MGAPLGVMGMARGGGRTAGTWEYYATGRKPTTIKRSGSKPWRSKPTGSKLTGSKLTGSNAG